MNYKSLFAGSCMLLIAALLVGPIQSDDLPSPAPAAGTAAAPPPTKTELLGEPLTVGGIEWSVVLTLELDKDVPGSQNREPFYLPASSAHLIGKQGDKTVFDSSIDSMVEEPDCGDDCSTLYTVPEIDKDVLFVDGNSGGSACCAIVTAVSVSKRKILDQLVVGSIWEHPAEVVKGVLSFKASTRESDVEVRMDDIDPHWNTTGYLPDVSVIYHFVGGKFVPAVEAVAQVAADAMTRRNGKGKVAFHIKPNEHYLVLGQTKKEAHLYQPKEGLVGYVPNTAVKIEYH